jgi:cytochrome P450
MALARIEGRIALAEFARVFPEARISRTPQYRARLRFRGLDGLFINPGQMHEH